MPLHTIVSAESLRRLLVGFYRIGFDEFADLLHECLNVGRDHALREWPRFQGQPCVYVVMRNPRELGDRLLTLALQKGADDDA